MKEKFAKLINVKSIITILLTLVVCYLAIFKNFDIKDLYLMIISFYFGTQSTKDKSDKSGDIN